LSGPGEARPGVVLAGATGLVGRHCLTRLLEDPSFDRVVAIGRRPPPISHPSLEPLLVDFEAWCRDPQLPPCETVICCLGTTRRKAGSRAAFRRVDRDYPVALARAGREAGATRFLLVSAVGADSRSRFFYNRVKGEAETAVQGPGYQLVGIVRPSLLLGEREEARPAEAIAALIGRRVRPLFRGPFRRYRPVRAADVAGALVALAHSADRGVRIVESEEIEPLARFAPGEDI